MSSEEENTTTSGENHIEGLAEEREQAPLSESSTKIDFSLVEEVARFAAKGFQGLFDAALRTHARARTNRVPGNSPGVSIGFTGCQSQVGTTSAIIHAGIYAAIERDLKTILVDANFRSPRLSQTFGQATASGLSDCLMDSAKLETSIYKTEISKLSLLPSGGQSLKSQPNLSASFQGLLQEIASIADVIVLDLSNAGGQVIQLFGPACDQVILVANPFLNPPGKIRSAKNRLKGHNILASGLFLNHHRV